MVRPHTANAATMAKATSTARDATARRVPVSSPSVRPRKIGVFATGFMIAKNAMSTVEKCTAGWVIARAPTCRGQSVMRVSVRSEK